MCCCQARDETGESELEGQREKRRYAGSLTVFLAGVACGWLEVSAGVGGLDKATVGTP